MVVTFSGSRLNTASHPGFLRCANSRIQNKYSNANFDQIFVSFVRMMYLEVIDSGIRLHPRTACHAAAKRRAECLDNGIQYVK